MLLPIEITWGMIIVTLLVAAALLWGLASLAAYVLSERQK